MSIELLGNWKLGFAYDVHTLGSVYLGADEQGRDHWDTTRSEMGELVYQLKYRNDISVVRKIVDLLGVFKGLETMDIIIPIPSTNKTRIYQPVFEIARELGKRVNVMVLEHILEKSQGGAELKNIDDLVERENLLKQTLFLSDASVLTGKNVLLVDDLYRSGVTLSIATTILYQQAKVKDVYVLTMTKTRSKK